MEGSVAEVVARLARCIFGVAKPSAGCEMPIRVLSAGGGCGVKRVVGINYFLGNSGADVKLKPPATSARCQLQPSFV